MTVRAPITIAQSRSRFAEQTLVHLFLFLAAWLLCAAKAHAQTTTGLALDDMFASFISNISRPLVTIVVDFAYIFGIYLIGKGLFKAVKYSDEGSKGQQKFGGIWGTLFIGAFMCYLPSMVSQVGATIFSDSTGDFGGATHTLSYANVDTEVMAKINHTYQAMIVFLQVIGIISFTRGLSVLRSVTDGNTQVTSTAGLTHVIGGAIAWNFGDFVDMIGNTINYNIFSGTAGGA